MYGRCAKLQTPWVRLLPARELLGLAAPSILTFRPSPTLHPKGLKPSFLLSFPKGGTKWLRLPPAACAPVEPARCRHQPPRAPLLCTEGLKTNKIPDQTHTHSPAGLRTGREPRRGSRPPSDKCARLLVATCGGAPRYGGRGGALGADTSRGACGSLGKERLWEYPWRDFQNK